MSRPKKLCVVCETKPTRKVGTRVCDYNRFCSMSCAARYGLRCADETETEHGFDWCNKCGWYQPAFNNQQACDCVELLREEDDHE